MSKKLLKKATAKNRVFAVFARFNGNNIDDRNRVPLYDLYGPAWMKR